MNKGQMKSAGSEPFAEPMAELTAPIKNMGGGMTNLGDMSGFKTSGYIDKKGTPYGEAAKFNMMPPGMELSNQEVADIRDLPMKRITDLSYPGDGY